jgi:Na+-driven multidrug efflux pump
MDVATGMLRGIGSSIAPMVITVAGVCGFRIIWIYTVFMIPEYHKVQTLYLSYTISWLATFLIELVVFMIMLRHMEKNSCAAIQ